MTNPKKGCGCRCKRQKCVERIRTLERQTRALTETVEALKSVWPLVPLGGVEDLPAT